MDARTSPARVTLINGVPIASFSAFSNKLEVRSASFKYAVTIPPGLFHQNSEGYYFYEGRIGGEHLELRIVPNTPTSYTLNAEGAGVPITVGKSSGVVLMIGTDMGAGAATSDD